MDADLEVGDEETTTSTQYSNGQAHHSTSTASVIKVRFRDKGVEGRGGKAGTGNATHASVYVCWSRPRHNFIHVCKS